MRRLFFPLFLCALMMLMPIGARAYTFYRDLKGGDAGEDVRVLQQILNTRPETLVASYGPGSPGQETTYFGEKTKAAVISYQELFAANILMPLGLFTGTGYVGPSTRAALSGVAMISPNAAPLGASPSDTIKASQINEADFEGTPAITSLGREFTAEGVVITVSGTGFTRSDNEAHTNHGTFDDIDSIDGRTLTFIIKGATASSVSGTLDSALFIKNKNGKSGLAFFTLGQ